jgi:hypothetical protein
MEPAAKKAACTNNDNTTLNSPIVTPMAQMRPPAAWLANSDATATPAAIKNIVRIENRGSSIGVDCDKAPGGAASYSLAVSNLKVCGPPLAAARRSEPRGSMDVERVAEALPKDYLSAG